jgi:Predicted membrane protein
MLETVLFQALVAIGTIAFAISGSFKAFRHELDVLGVLVLGFATALGGGLMRDALLHTTPATFIDIGPAIYALAGCLIAIVLYAAFKGLVPHIALPEGTLFLFFDAVGLAAFTVLGARLAAEAGMNAFGIVLLAAITGAGGGVLRDLLVMEVPLALKADFYATATIIGGIMFTVLLWMGTPIPIISALTFAVTLALRLLAVWQKWQLPRIGQKI